MAVDAGISLIPLQAAYAVTGAPAMIGQAVKPALHAHTNTILTADVHNAFNTIATAPSSKHCLKTVLY
jgi:hypothetical protein